MRFVGCPKECVLCVGRNPRRNLRNVHSVGYRQQGTESLEEYRLYMLLDAGGCWDILKRHVLILSCYAISIGVRVSLLFKLPVCWELI
jgi:hypothetical protein